MRPMTGSTSGIPTWRLEASDGEWAAFVMALRAEMNKPMARRSLDLLSALSHSSRFSIGCYCEDESRCHRSVLRELLSDRRAWIG